MPRLEKSATPPSFWHCGRCGTPNPWASYLIHCLGCGAGRPPRPASVPASSSPEPLPTARRPSSLWGRGLSGASWTYGLLILGLVALGLGIGERWWGVTTLLFGPRAILLIPPLLLAVIAGWARRRRLWVVHLATIFLIVVPLMGLNLPFVRLFAHQPEGPRLRVLTLNQGGPRVDGEALIGLIEREHVQLIFLQESYYGAEGRLAPELEAFLDRGGWHRDRENTIASRFPSFTELEPLADADGPSPYWRARLNRARIGTASGREFLVASVHLPTARPGLNALLAGDLVTFRRHSAWRAERAALAARALADRAGLPILVGGDFNMPPQSPSMRQALAVTGLRDGFQEVGWGFGYSKPVGFPWIRIDYLLASPPWDFVHCWAGPDVGSDHLPVLADLILPSMAETSP